jgi:hypothetical protein
MLPISILKKVLDKKLGEGAWKSFETETLVLELDLPQSDLLFDKVSVLKVIENIPEIFFDDISFLIYSTSVMNDQVADFEYLPHITSLEIALAIEEMSRVLGVELHQLPLFTTGPKAFIRDILINEGYSKVLPPFDIVGVGRLAEGQTEQDTADKAKAIEGYIHAIYNSSSN